MPEHHNVCPCKFSADWAVMELCSGYAHKSWPINRSVTLYSPSKDQLQRFGVEGEEGDPFDPRMRQGESWIFQMLKFHKSKTSPKRTQFWVSHAGKQHSWGFKWHKYATRCSVSGETCKFHWKCCLRFTASRYSAAASASLSLEWLRLDSVKRLCTCRSNPQQPSDPRWPAVTSEQRKTLQQTQLEPNSFAASQGRKSSFAAACNMLTRCSHASSAQIPEILANIRSADQNFGQAES